MEVFREQEIPLIETLPQGVEVTTRGGGGERILVILHPSAEDVSFAGVENVGPLCYNKPCFTAMPVKDGGKD